MKGIRPSPSLTFMFRNRFICYREGLLASRPNLKLEDHPRRLSAAAYSTHSQLTAITGGRPSIRDPRTRHAARQRPRDRCWCEFELYSQ
jgi:hypothetical protein